MNIGNALYATQVIYIVQELCAGLYFNMCKQWQGIAKIYYKEHISIFIELYYSIVEIVNLYWHLYL